MLAVGLIVVSVLVVNAMGGLGTGAREGRARATGQWRAPGESTIEVLNRWAIPILGSLTAQELVSRIVACRSPEVAQRAAWMASGAYLSIGILPVGLGLMATQASLQVVDAEHVLPALAATHLPQIGYVLFVGALVSAILSTVDSCLLVSGSLISHNLVVPQDAGDLGARQAAGRTRRAWSARGWRRGISRWRLIRCSAWSRRPAASAAPASSC